MNVWTCEIIKDIEQNHVRNVLLLSVMQCIVCFWDLLTGCTSDLNLWDQAGRWWQKVILIINRNVHYTFFIMCSICEFWEWVTEGRQYKMWFIWSCCCCCCFIACWKSLTIFFQCLVLSSILLWCVCFDVFRRGEDLDQIH